MWFLELLSNLKGWLFPSPEPDFDAQREEELLDEDDEDDEDDELQV